MAEMEYYTFRFRVYQEDKKTNSLKSCGSYEKTIGTYHGEERAEELAVRSIRWMAAKEQNCSIRDIVIATGCLLGEYNFY